MTQNTALVQGYFKNHKAVNELFFVGSLPFFNLEDAQSHVKSLKKDIEIEKVTREEAFAGEAPESAEEMLDVEVTQEILDENPELVEQGIALGEMIQVPKDDTQSTQEEIKQDVKAAVTTGKARKPKATAKKSPAKKK